MECHDSSPNEHNTAFKVVVHAHQWKRILRQGNQCVLLGSTPPYGIDDLQTGKVAAKANKLDLPELIVDLYNAAKSANAMKGSKKPKSVPVVTTNWNLRDDDRYSDYIEWIGLIDIGSYMPNYKFICIFIHLIARRCSLCPSGAWREHLLCPFLDHQ